MADVIDAHTTAGGIFLFTVAQIDNNDYADMVTNWRMSVDASFGSSNDDNARELSQLALVVTTAPAHCERLHASAPLASCIVDPGFISGSSNIVHVKFSWTIAALQRGAAVLYNDPDLAYYRDSDPLAALVASRAATSASSSLDSIPWMQLLSDHMPGDVVDLPAVSLQSLCPPGPYRFQLTLAELARTSVDGDWHNATYEKLSSPYAATLGTPGSAAFSAQNLLTDFLGLECMMRYDKPYGCISTGFWFILSRPQVLNFYQRVLIESLHGVWEQKAFNVLLPHFAKNEAPGTVVVLDPAQFGNVDAQNCARVSRNVSRILTHTGYRFGNHQDPSKYGALRDSGVWYLSLY